MNREWTERVGALPDQHRAKFEDPEVARPRYLVEQAEHRWKRRLARQVTRGHAFAQGTLRFALFHPALTREASMFTDFTPADLVAILNIPRLQTLPNSFKILREYRLSVVALVFSR